ncbi:MAG: phosphorylase family protein [Gammaproteobacteria bacterium]
MITGVVVALPEELTTLTSKKADRGECFFLGDKVLVVRSGAGPENARSSAEQLVGLGAARLISWGCAAGLSASVRPGDLIVADRLVSDEGDSIAIDSAWRRHSIRLLNHRIGKKREVRSGTIAESRVLISGSRDKKQRHSISGAVALDMESGAVAKVARHHNIDFLSIRAIADPAAMDLPKAIGCSLNDQGEVLLGRLLFHLAQHPLELPGLIMLGMHFNKAKQTLKQTAGQLESITGHCGHTA